MEFLNTQKENKDESSKETNYFDFKLFGSCDYVYTDKLGMPVRRCNKPSIGTASLMASDGTVQEMQLCSMHMFLVARMSNQMQV